MTQQRRLKAAQQASLPPSVLFQTEVEGGRSAQSRLSAAVHSLLSSVLSFPKLLLVLGHGNDAILCRLNGLFKDYKC
jgi:hypothetical protein